MVMFHQQPSFFEYYNLTQTHPPLLFYVDHSTRDFSTSFNRRPSQQKSHFLSRCYEAQFYNLPMGKGRKIREMKNHLF